MTAYAALSDAEKADLLERLRARVGRPSGPPGPPARDAVNRAMIHHLCDALGDTNPLYLDEPVARGTRVGEVVAPPTSLQVWGMGRPRYGTATLAGTRAAASDGTVDPQAHLSQIGFNGVVATNCEQVYERSIRPGEVMRISGSLDSVSDEKHTALGIGYFTTTRSTYLNQDDEVVGHHLFRILRYIPGTGRTTPQGGGTSTPQRVYAFREDLEPEEAEAVARGEWSEASLPRSSTLRYDEVGTGDELPRLVLPMFPLRIIGSALATRDFQDVHHDREAAQAKKNADIFPNILTTNGWVGRFVTDWTGPDAIMKSCAIRLGAPAYCYDILHFTGRVTAKEDNGVVEVAVNGRCALGDHVTGSVRIALP